MTFSLRIAPIAIAVILGAAIGYFLHSESTPKADAPAFSAMGNKPTLVETTDVEETDVYHRIESLGTLTANESLTITAKVTETVRNLHFDDGDLVEAGDILAELTNAEQSALLAEARANLDESERQLKRLREIGSQLASESAIEQAEAQVAAYQARLEAIIARMDDRLIRAPFAGLLGFRLVSPGTLLTPGTAITTLDDIATLKLDFSIPETLLSEVQVGARVEAYSSAWPEQTFAGEVTAIDSRVDPVTRAATIRARIPNPDLLLRPGMLMTTEVLTSSSPGLVIPEEALVQNAAESYVFVVDENSTAQRRPIRFSQRWQNNIVIESGLEPGEEIVTAGVFKLRPGTRVAVAGNEADQEAGDRPQTAQSSEQ